MISFSWFVAGCHVTLRVQPVPVPPVHAGPAFGSPTGAVAVDGVGRFDGVMLGSFKRPRIEGHMTGDAMRAWDEGVAFEELVRGDGEVTSRLDGERLARVFDIGSYTRHVDTVFERLEALAAGREEDAYG